MHQKSSVIQGHDNVKEYLIRSLDLSNSEANFFMGYLYEKYRDSEKIILNE